jgi:hypothetical protein
MRRKRRRCGLNVRAEQDIVVINNAETPDSHVPLLYEVTQAVDYPRSRAEAVVLARSGRAGRALACSPLCSNATRADSRSSHSASATGVRENL